MAKVKLRKRQVALRYQCHPRTIERWVDDPLMNFPKPIYICRSPLWDESELDEWDKTRPRQRPIPNPPPRAGVLPDFSDLDIEDITREAAE
jgi:predicted DNA-binding transcriptional regulator AlpA